MGRAKKTLIVCLDGFTWLSGDLQLEAGNMPFLSGLRNSGSSGVLKSVIPWETGPSWTTFQTGCRPGKTSITSFQRYDKRTKTLSLNSHKVIHAKTLWSQLGSYGRKFICVNLPVMYPAEYENGIVVPGLLCPGIKADTVHPQSIYNDYIKPLGGYCITRTGIELSPAEFVDQQIVVERTRVELAKSLMRKEPWDLFCIQIHGTDNMQHYLWPYLERSAPGFTQDGFNIAGRFYRECDKMVSELVEQAGEDTLVVVVSDHGFCRLERRLCLNTWFRGKGYLTVLERPKSAWNKVKDNFMPARVLGRFYGKYIKPKAGRDEEFQWAKFMLTNLRNNLDIEKSKCFALGTSGGLVYFNVPQSDKGAFFEKLKGELLEEFGEGSKSPCIKRIESGCDMYGVADNDFLPDMVIEYLQGVSSETTPANTGAILGPDAFSENQVGMTGTHSQDGIIVMHGRDINGGQKIDGAGIADITPTVLAYMGIEVPSGIDGRVLGEYFKEPLKYTSAGKDNGSSANRQDSYSAGEKDKIERELASLGYM